MPRLVWRAAVGCSCRRRPRDDVMLVRRRTRGYGHGVGEAGRPLLLLLPRGPRRYHTRTELSIVTSPGAARGGTVSALGARVRLSGSSAPLVRLRRLGRGCRLLPHCHRVRRGHALRGGSPILGSGHDRVWRGCVGLGTLGTWAPSSGTPAGILFWLLYED